MKFTRNLLLLFIVLAACRMNLSAQVIYQTSFEASEGYTANTPVMGVNGWVVQSNFPYIITSADAAYDGSQSLAFAGNTGRYAYRNFTNSAKKVRVEMTMGKASDGTNSSDFFFALGGSDGKRSAAFGFNKFNSNGVDGMWLSYFSGGAWRAVSACQAGKAYSFKADVDLYSKTWTLWVDNQLIANKVALYDSAATSATQLYFYRNYSGTHVLAQAAVDAIRVTAIPEPSSLAAMLSGLLGFAGFICRRK